MFCLVGPFFYPTNKCSQIYRFFEDFFDYLEDTHLQQRIEMWFQLDECPAHYGRTTRAWLDRHFLHGIWTWRNSTLVTSITWFDTTRLFYVGDPEARNLFIVNKLKRIIIEKSNRGYSANITRSVFSCNTSCSY